MNTKASLIRELKQLGLTLGDTVFVHASVRAIGKTLGGPDMIHLAISEAISSNGTMMMYVGCEPEFDGIGRAKYSSEEENFLKENLPAFDFQKARARRDYGTLAEFFRSYPGVMCSQNPGARVAAIGAKAAAFTAYHPLNYGYGPGSPFAKFCDQQGKILLLGSDLDQVTLLHYAEHICPLTSKRIVKYQTPLLKNNKRDWVNIEEYDTSVGIRQWPERFFSSILESFIKIYGLQSQKIGDADTYLIDANMLINFAVENMQKNQEAFV